VGRSRWGGEGGWSGEVGVRTEGGHHVRMWFARGGNSEYGEVGSRQNGVVVRWGGNADEGILYGVVMGGGGRKGMVGEGGGVGEKG